MQLGPAPWGEGPGRLIGICLRCCVYTMNVLNAVPLSATASSRATAFSLIMVMVLVPCSVVVGVARTFRGEREHPGRA